MRAPLFLPFLLLACVAEPSYPSPEFCKAAAEEAARVAAAEKCPEEAGPWDECPHAKTIEDSLQLSLELCDVR